MRQKIRRTKTKCEIKYGLGNTRSTFEEEYVEKYKGQYFSTMEKRVTFEND